MNWLQSDQGWVFYLLVLGAIVWISFNLAVFFRRLPEQSIPMSALSRDERGNRMLVEFARILSVVGILTILSSALLPGGLFTPRSEYYLRLFLGIIRIFLYAMGLFWLTFLAASRKVRAVSAVIWGSLVLLLTSLDAAVAASDSIGNGTLLTFLGSLALIAGSAFVYMKTEKAVKAGPVPLAQSVPPSL